MSPLRLTADDGSLRELEIPIAPSTDLRFEAMGTRIRLLVGAPTRAGMPPAPEAAAIVRAWIEGFDRRLSRFRPESELNLLNSHPGRVFAASPLLSRLVESALEAAEISRGLVDPTMLGEIERAGYGTSRRPSDEPLLAEALVAAPPRRPAAPDPRERWRRFGVDPADGSVSRDPGLVIDSGGIGKGLAADMAFEMLRGHQRFLIDCGGDIRVGGIGARLDPYQIEVEHPLDRSRRRRVRLATGAVATSGIDRRIWRSGDGFSHHLLDPATGCPAWTGVISATAIAPTAVAAETLSKAALLSGPAGARRVLAAHGGLFVTDDGSGEIVRAPARATAPGFEAARGRRAS